MVSEVGYYSYIVLDIRLAFVLCIWKNTRLYLLQSLQYNFYNRKARWLTLFPLCQINENDFVSERAAVFVHSQNHTSIPTNMQLALEEGVGIGTQ